MPKCKIFNELTQLTEEGLNFGGSNQEVYDVAGTLVYAPPGGTSITETASEYTLVGTGLTILKNTLQEQWELISHQNVNTCSWRVTMQNKVTGEVKTGVYPFNLDGQVYQLECGGEWVLASCGGYEIVNNHGNGGICYTLTGTGETIRLKRRWQWFNMGVSLDYCGSSDAVFNTDIPFSFYDEDVHDIVYRGTFGSWPHCNIEHYGNVVTSSVGQQILDTYSPPDHFIYKSDTYVLSSIYHRSRDYYGGSYNMALFGVTYDVY